MFKERRGDTVKWLEDATNLNENEGTCTVKISVLNQHTCTVSHVC